MKEPGGGRRFTAELELSELDTRMRDGAHWSARATAISHSRLWIRSRRMCYPGSKLVVKIHYIDDEPFILIGAVARCEYDAEGMYDLELGLEAAQNRSVLGKSRTLARTRTVVSARA